MTLMWFTFPMYLLPLKLRRGDRDVLESWTRAGTIEARLANRARIILMAADGTSNRDIGDVVGMHYNQVGLWRKRYGELGLAGLVDEERPGRPCVYDHDDVLLLVKTVTEEPPGGATRWTMEALAQAMSAHGVPISASQCWRICKALDLKPWQVESWMTSHDPDFWEKAADVCGLYLNPPENAIVWSVDEKTSIQAKARINPAQPAVPGAPERREFEYERNGTMVLFAGLNVHEGDVAAWVTDSTCSDNFVTFLWDLMDQTPTGMQLHCIVDNLSAHQTDQVAELLEYNPRVHLHFTPTHASWLNQVELFFSILERRLLRRGDFASVEELTARIIAFIKDYNRRSAPFRWTYEGRPLKAA
jgi:transposase